MQIHIIKKEENFRTPYDKEEVVDFLYDHLEEYGDKKEDIAKAIDYIFKPQKGGLVAIGVERDQLVGAVVINETGMEGYIPENILVYISIHAAERGKGSGKKLMQAAIDEAEGNIALHVEPHNPAVHLYKKLGFTNKYLEMRLNKKN